MIMIKTIIEIMVIKTIMITMITIKMFINKTIEYDQMI